MSFKGPALFLLAISIASLSFGQSAAGSKSSSASGQSDSQGAGGGLGFSIESEMMTYKSVQANSEAIACDIARYLYGNGAGSSSPNGSCDVQSRADASFGVVLVSPSGTTLSDFQAWRADMATIRALQQRANTFCGIEAQEETKGAAKAVPTPFDFSIPGQMMPLVGSALGLFATNQSVTAVGGTVHNHALINAVARQLRTFKVSVLVPEIYNPYGLAPANYSNSPFFSGLAALSRTRTACVEAAKTADPSLKSSINDVVASIEAFMAMILGGAHPPAKTAGEDSKDKTSGNQQTPAVDSTAHLSRVLAADNLARAMGMTSDNPDGTGSKWHYVLWLEALESGGSVLRRGNIFGTKIRYSGGAVATYALFSLDGNLDCSGNVYDFQGSVKPEDFQESFRKPLPAPTQQLTFLRGGCSPPQ
jgi:hypothetical protein